MRSICSIVPCGSFVVGHGYCSTHYNRWRKHGDPYHVVKVRRMGTCSVSTCERVHYARGYCRLHWERNHRYGDPEVVHLLIGASIRERLARYSKRLDGCLVWTGYCDRDGYGIIEVEGKSLRAHRVSYEAYVGAIPDGLLLRHKCDNPPCIDPDHLEPGTEYENAQDRVGRGRSLTGQDNPAAHLTDSEVLEIYRRLLDGEDRRSLAAKFGVGRSTIHRIRHGLAWARVTGHHVDA